MKRIIALSLAVLMIAALFCACGEKKDDSNSGDASAKTVKTVIAVKDDDGTAEKYAKNVTTDSNGNKVYEFDAESYKDYTRNHNNKVSAAITQDVIKAHDTGFGQYCYINDDKKAVIVGVNPGKYDEASAKKEASSLAEKSFTYFKGLSEVPKTVSVQYVNANDQDEVYGSFEFEVK